MPTVYRLKYFKNRGRAEIIRLMLTLAGQNFEDIRLTQEQFQQKEKAAAPFGQLPTLEIDGVVYSQSMGIARYIAKKYGFYGKNDIEFFGIEEVLGIAEDCMASMIRQYLEKDEEKKAEITKENNDKKYPFYMHCFEKILNRNEESGFFIGSGISLADIAVFSISEWLPPINIEETPRLSQWKELVSKDSRIEKWLQIRTEREK